MADTAARTTDLPQDNRTDPSSCTSCGATYWLCAVALAASAAVHPQLEYAERLVGRRGTAAIPTSPGAAQLKPQRRPSPCLPVPPQLQDPLSTRR